jgi:hypothetical protein
VLTVTVAGAGPIRPAKLTVTFLALAGSVLYSLPLTVTVIRPVSVPRGIRQCRVIRRLLRHWACLFVDVTDAFCADDALGVPARNTLAVAAPGPESLTARTSTS